LLRAELASLVAASVDRLIASGDLPEAARLPVEIIDTKDPAHGDYATNFALVAAKPCGMNPRAVAEKLASVLSGGLIEAVEIAGPGFLNFRLNAAAVAAHVPGILELGEDVARHSSPETPLKINVEFVSVNPNGPITVGSGRGAAFGDTLSRVLEAAGHTVNREYYINDGVNSEQMRQFAESVRSYVEGLPFPEKGYKGDYVKNVAEEVKAGDGSGDVGWYQSVSQKLMLKRQRGDLSLFGVEFDTWFSEQSLHDSGEVARKIDELEAKGAADTLEHRTKIKFGRNGAIEEVTSENQAKDDDEGDNSELEARSSEQGKTLWLRSSKFGDDMDRVLRRRDGRLTYIASDVAYHADKFNRPPNADKLITVLGPDHHGYIGRLHAVLAALLLNKESVTSSGAELTQEEAKIYTSSEERDACLAALKEARERLEVIIFQIVRFVKDGQPAPMRKRDGNIYELRDLITELGAAQAPNASKEEQERIGADVARFFYLMRSHDTHMDFDIDLATKQSDENPVFYVQYAHARICSVLAKAAGSIEALKSWSIGDPLPAFDSSLLTHPRELALIKKILDLPEEVQRCAKDYGVHRLTTYSIELARSFHHFYDACRVVQPDQPELSLARVALCQAARVGLKSALALVGVSAPERMERILPSFEGGAGGG
jgi:arginyl-tRNA synthetase